MTAAMAERMTRQTIGAAHKPKTTAAPTSQENFCLFNGKDCAYKSHFPVHIEGRLVVVCEIFYRHYRYTIRFVERPWKEGPRCDLIDRKK
jgi:hypothetical protein